MASFLLSKRPCQPCQERKSILLSGPLVIESDPRPTVDSLRPMKPDRRVRPMAQADRRILVSFNLGYILQSTYRRLVLPVRRGVFENYS